MNTKIKSINTWLPVFSGFYNTIWEFSENYVLEYINEEREGDIDLGNLDIDYTQFENDIAIEFVNEIKSLLCDYIENIEFEKLVYPKEYNFKNDSINISIIPKSENISKFIYENKEKFCLYLKNTYTGCDGYIPYYSNDFGVWENDTLNFSNFTCNTHYLGSILQFISEVLNINEIDIYYNIELNYMEYINNYEKCLHSPICNKCNKFIENINILQDIEKYKDITKKYPSYILCDECIEHY